MSERTIRTRCACGWESAGPVESVVVATIEHGQRMHNMVASRDQVLERAELLDEGGGPAAGASGSTATPGTPSATAGTSTGSTGT